MILRELSFELLAIGYPGVGERVCGNAGTYLVGRS